jgi:hypothetical protein
MRRDHEPRCEAVGLFKPITQLQHA